MKTLLRFVAEFTSLIVSLLSCFDRVRFTGHLPISNRPARHPAVQARRRAGRSGPTYRLAHRAPERTPSA